MLREVSVAETAAALLAGAGAARAASCRLCLGDTRLGCLALDDSVLLQRTFCEPALALADILSAVGGAGAARDTDPHRSRFLCLVCANAAIDAYIFREFCAHAQRRWTRVRRSLLACDLSPALAAPPPAALYILLQEECAQAVADRAPAPNVKRAAQRVRRLVARRARGATESELQCTDCGRLFARQDLLRRHAAVHARELACPDCPRVFLSRFKYRVHRDRAHGPKSFPCDACPRTFASPFLVEEHRRAMHTRGECGVCGKAYTTRKGLNDHVKTHSVEWTCACGRVYKYREGLRQHESCCTAAGGARGRFACEHCSKCYSFKHTLRQHVQFAHGAHPIRCEECGKKFSTRNALRNHAAVHTGVKNYACEACGDTFMSSTTLNYHVRARHTHDKPFPCHLCPEAFITSARRTEHARRRHGAPAPACTLCARTFTTPACLRRHLARHRHHTTPHPPTHTALNINASNIINT